MPSTTMARGLTSRRWSRGSKSAYRNFSGQKRRPMPQIEIAVIVMRDAVNVLIVKPLIGPDAGKWIIPMDAVNEGEKLIEAAERVVKDQCGLSTIPKRILFPLEIVEPDYHHVVLVGFSECG